MSARVHVFESEAPEIQRQEDRNATDYRREDCQRFFHGGRAVNRKDQPWRFFANDNGAKPNRANGKRSNAAST